VSRIIIGKSGKRNIGFDLDVLLPSRLLITADSGGGKSWVMRVLQEQLFGKVQVITIDPEGEFASLREKFPFVLVGKGGETPADTRSAALVAERLLKLRASAVCDIYDMKPHLRHSWVKLFIEGLIEAPKELRNPLVLIVDEAHVFGPEKGESEALGAMIDAATRGRKRGICLVCATQRLAMLNKDITSNLQNRLVGPTFEDVNRKRAGEMLGVLPGAPMRQFFHQIQLLKPGNFFAFGRAIAEKRTLVNVNQIQTTHPKAFGAKHAAPPPPTPEKIKALLPKLADLPREAEEKARTEADFRREIRELKTKLSVAERAQPRTAVDVAKVYPAPGKTIQQLRGALREAVKMIAKFESQTFDAVSVDREQVEAIVKNAVERIVGLANSATTHQRKQFESLKREAKPALEKLQRLLDQKDPQAVPIATAPVKPQSVNKVSRPPKEPSISISSDGDSSSLRRGAKQIAGILAAYYPNAIKRRVLAALCGRPDGGGFGNDLSDLRGAGLLEDVGRGELKATEKCSHDFIGSVQPPTNTEEVLSLWQSRLSNGAFTILKFLADHGGEPIHRTELAERVGRPDGGGFGNNLSELRIAGLLDDPDKGVVAANKEAMLLPEYAA
jgi:hypothetical protein